MINRYTVNRGDKRHYDLKQTLLAFEQGAKKRKPEGEQTPEGGKTCPPKPESQKL